MIRIKKIVLLLVCICSGAGLNAQDPNFSHFFNNTLYYNPAATAIHSGFRFSGNMRALWTHVPSNFNTVFVGAEALALNKTGLGFSYLHDGEGEGKLRTNNLSLYYSYRPVETRNFQIQAGFQSAVVMKHIDFTSFVFSDQLDEVYGNVNSTDFIAPANDRIVYPDFAAGVMMMLNSPNHENRDLKLFSTLGFAVHHLTNPTDQFFNSGGKLPLKYNLTATTNIFYQNVIYAPAFNWEQQGPFNTFTAGINMVRNPIYAGFWIRNRTLAMKGTQYDSFVFNIGSNIDLHDAGARVKVCYSYDFTISRLRTSTMGTHEISVIYEIDDYMLFAGAAKRKQSRYKNRFLKCVHGV